MAVKVLDKKLKENFTAYYCTECKKILAVEDNQSGSAWTYDQCNHYSWAIVSITCFYNYYRCDKKQIEELKSKSVLKIQNTKYVFLLVPNEAK